MWILGIFVVTDPLTPPPVSNDPQIIPDFDVAWQTAWSKAQARLSSFSIDDKVTRIHLSLSIVSDFASLLYRLI